MAKKLKKKKKNDEYNVLWLMLGVVFTLGVISGLLLSFLF